MNRIREAPHGLHSAKFLDHNRFQKLNKGSKSLSSATFCNKMEAAHWYGGTPQRLPLQNICFIGISGISLSSKKCIKA